MAFEESEDQVEFFDLRNVIEFIRQNLPIIVAAAAVFGTLGWGISTYVLVPQYRASATVIVNKGPDSDGAMSAITYNDLLLSQKLVKTYSIIMQSDTVLEKVIDSLKMTMTAGQIRNGLSVSPVNNTEVLKVAFTHTDRELAARVANEIVRQAPLEIIRMAKVGSVEVVDWATVPASAIKPQKRLNALAAAFIGGLMAAGLLFLREQLDNTFKSEEDLKRCYGLPVLGILPVFRPESLRRKKYRSDE